MKPLFLIVLLLLANTVAAAEPISGKEYSQEEFDAMKKAAESQGMVPSGDTTNEQEEFEFRLRMEQEAKTKRRYTTEELDAMQEAEQSRNAAEEQRGRLAKQQAQLAKDNYACLLEYRTSAPVIQAPLGGDIGAVLMQGQIEQVREEKYVQACLESKGWVHARNAESTK